MKALYSKPNIPGELVYLGNYNGKFGFGKEDEEYKYDLWFAAVNHDVKLVVSKSKNFCSFVSFYTEDLATEHDGLKEAIGRAYNKGLDLL